MPNKQPPKSISDNKEENNVQKRKKRSKIIKRIMKIIVVIALLIGGIAFALTSPLFNISSIEITGNEKFAKDKYIKLSGLEMNNNIFKFKKFTVVDNIKQNAYVESVKIKRVLPKTVEIIITERKIKFLVEMQDKSKYAYIDEDGNILEISNEKLDYIVLKGISEESINVGEKIDETYRDRIKDVVKIQNIMQNNEVETFNIIDISSKYDYILSFDKEAKYVYLGDLSDLETKILYMKYILEEQEGIPGSIYLNQSKAYFSPE